MAATITGNQTFLTFKIADAEGERPPDSSGVNPISSQKLANGIQVFRINVKLMKTDELIGFRIEAKTLKIALEMIEAYAMEVENGIGKNGTDKQAVTNFVLKHRGREWRAFIDHTKDAQGNTETGVVKIYKLARNTRTAKYAFKKPTAVEEKVNLTKEKLKEIDTLAGIYGNLHRVRGSQNLQLEVREVPGQQGQ